ncbi:hypothetical protein TELCIR_16920 [Teladorsagia circumcincta]|uniref:Uncharacterized protein n=1 Tax=Teladorsagia circumcincta TaxID=45464 RepID=A0A2G9TU93_TELCI|nr:hypothetical protein TELCIR_16920 [Teladorsagia circumcincta]
MLGELVGNCSWKSKLASVAPPLSAAAIVSSNRRIPDAAPSVPLHGSQVQLRLLNEQSSNSDNHLAAKSMRFAYEIKKLM